VTGEGTWNANRKEQMCYIVRINDFDDGTVFHIVKKVTRATTAES
jgi:hypothetical protein